MTLNELQRLLDIHRDKVFLTCDKTCMCWAIEQYIEEKENTKEDTDI